jgi:hypothetical protein
MSNQNNFIYMRDRLICEANELIIDQVHELEYYFNYLERIGEKKLADTQFKMAYQKIVLLKQSLEQDIEANNEADFDKYKIADEFIEIIRPQKESNSEDLKFICQNLIGFTNAIFDAVNLSNSARVEKDTDNLYEGIFNLGKISAEINNHDVERLGYKKNFQKSVDKRNKNFSEFTDAMISFLKSENFKFPRNKDAHNYKDMYDLFNSKKEALAQFLSSVLNFHFTVQTITKNDKVFLVIERNNFKYTIESAHEYGSKCSEKLKKFYT